MSSPTNYNENLKLKLSGAWEPRTVLKLCHLVREKRPAIVFLMETKVQHKSMERIKLKLRLMHGLMINPIRLKRGLEILWDQANDLEVINYSSFHIHTKIINLANAQCWFLIGFYGNPETSKRQNSWKLLSKISEYVEAPWCVLGGLKRDYFPRRKI